MRFEWERRRGKIVDGSLVDQVRLCAPIRRPPRPSPDLQPLWFTGVPHLQAVTSFWEPDSYPHLPFRVQDTALSIFQTLDNSTLRLASVTDRESDLGELEVHAGI